MNWAKLAEAGLGVYLILPGIEDAATGGAVTQSVNLVCPTYKGCGVLGGCDTAPLPAASDRSGVSFFAAGLGMLGLVVVRVLALAHTGHVLIVLWPRGRRVAAGAAGVEQARDCRRQDGLQAGGARLW